VKQKRAKQFTTNFQNEAIKVFAVRKEKQEKKSGRNPICYSTASKSPTSETRELLDRKIELEIWRNRQQFLSLLNVCLDFGARHQFIHISGRNQHQKAWKL